MKDLNVFFSTLAAILIAFWIILLSQKPYSGKDNSDSFDDHSGMLVLIDHLTGVNYMLSPLGGLTVRVDENGKPVTGDPKKLKGRK